MCCASYANARKRAYANSYHIRVGGRRRASRPKEPRLIPCETDQPPPTFPLNALAPEQQSDALVPTVSSLPLRSLCSPWLISASAIPVALGQQRGDLDECAHAEACGAHRPVRLTLLARVDAGDIQMRPVRVANEAGEHLRRGDRASNSAPSLLHISELPVSQL